MNDNPHKIFEAIASSDHRDPFAVLGPHHTADGWAVRTFQPRTRAVDLVDPSGAILAPMQRVHPAGLFEARVEKETDAYRLHVTEEPEERIIEGPYRFPSLFGEIDDHSERVKPSSAVTKRPVQACPVYPPDQDHARSLIELFTLGKAFSELRDQLDHRPDWVGVPLRGLLEFFG